MTAVKVVCTGRGTHKRRIFNEVTTTAEGLRCNTHRVANFAEAKGVCMTMAPRSLRKL